MNGTMEAGQPDWKSFVCPQTVQYNTNHLWILHMSTCSFFSLMCFLHAFLTYY